jgi:hypothetical protein
LLHVFVCIKHCKTDRIVPLCTCFLHRMPRSSGFSLLPTGGGGSRFQNMDRLSWRKVFVFFSVPRGHYRDCASYLATIISFHILPNLFFTFHPNILRCVVRTAARIVALTVIWVSVSLDSSLTSCDICETSVRFIDYLDSCKEWPDGNINAHSV